MDPLTIVNWLGVCAEPSIEEAQPAWWLELQRAEALQEEDLDSPASQEEHPALHEYTFGKDVDKLTVHFDQETASISEPHCYENDVEFVVSQEIYKTTCTQTPTLSQPEQMEPWELSDLDDLERLRRGLLPAVDTPPPSLASNSSAPSLVDLHCGSPPSETGPVFHVFHESLPDSQEFRSLNG